MKLLKEWIHKDGEVLDGDVLEINSFLNHQTDPELMMQVGEEFKHLFEDEKITKVLTCEAPRIASDITTAHQLGVPMIFVRKKEPSTPNDAVYWADVFSYTEKVNNRIYVEKKFLSSDDHLLITDNFLAYGEAVKEVLSITKQAGAAIVGVGVVIAKEFQGGSDWAKRHGYRLETLARISNFENNQVHFVEEK